MPGEEAEVRVRENGRVIDTIRRPLRELDGKPAVTYRKQLWPLIGDSIEIAAGIPASPTAYPPSSPTRPDHGHDESVLTERSPSRQTLTFGPEVHGEREHTEQDDPVGEPSDARLLVDAGPGTGKTHTACARVAALVNSGIPASRICLLSFTRTAIVEIRNRIAGALEDPSDAASVRIITLDAFAWVVQSGFSDEARLTGSFEDNIYAAHRMIRDDPDVRDDMARIEHLIVDEAQDIVGPRADLVLEIASAIPAESGVTVFADRAQAIYGFSEGEEQAEGTNLINALVAKGYRRMCLTKVHRTSDPRLLAIFTDLRRDLLDGRRADLEKHVRSEITRMAHAPAGEAVNLNVADLAEDSLVLMRNRMDVLYASSRAGLQPHRLRLSGLPMCVHAWMAQLLWDYVQKRISRDDFEKLWHERGILAPLDCEEAWSRCVELAGDSHYIVDLHRLRKALARANPPMMFCSPEFGTSGPILGTIHASKGREAPTVYLYLQERTRADEKGEEARVMFVGATRPRERLLVGTTSAPPGHSRINGRVWRRTENSVQIEVGRPFDLEPAGLVGRPFFARQDEAMAAQARWFAQPVRSGMLLRAEPNLGWLFTLNDGDHRLAGLSEYFRSDINQIAWSLNKHITWLGHGRSIGLRTMVVAPDSAHLESMLEPWKSSGFLFAPLITSLSLSRPRSR